MSALQSSDHLFDNCVIQAPDGEVLARCPKRRVEWYLNRDMADKVSDNPLTIRLKFEPSGRRSCNDPFNLSDKPNHCVVCGKTNNLTRHHVIPHCIIKYMPDTCKLYNSHDIMPMCVRCHIKYERHSEQKRKEMADKLGVPVHGLVNEEAKGRIRASSAAKAINQHGDKMPAERRDQLLTWITEYIGRTPTEQDLKELGSMPPRQDHEFTGFGKFVLDSCTDFNELAKEWRQHFLDSMKPKHMMQHWRVDRQFYES